MTLPRWFQWSIPKPSGSGFGRRGFLARLLTVPAGRSMITPPLEPSPSLLLGQFYVAGFQYSKGPEVSHQLRVGQSYRLMAEPDNPHDQFAVAIYWQDNRLGYVPKQENRPLSRWLQQGGRLHCEAVSVDVEAEPWLVLQVAVWSAGARVPA